MNNLKRGTTAVAYRYVPDPTVLDVYGKETLKVKRCKQCGEVKNQSDFYHNQKNTIVPKPFEICCGCDDKNRLLRGKVQRRREKGIHVDKNLDEISNLMDFFNKTS